MGKFNVPENLGDLKEEKLNELLQKAITAFEAKRAEENLSAADLDELRELTQAVEKIRTELSAREDAAKEVQAELDQLANRVKGDKAEEVEETEEEVEEEVEEGQQQLELVTASSKVQAVKRPKLVLPKNRIKPSLDMTASADVPGYAAGQKIETIEDLVPGIVARANALKSAGKNGSQAYVASYRLPFDDALIVNDAHNAAEGTTAVLAARDQRRLPGKDLVASGGWCAPSETIYEINDLACPDGLWDLPEIQLRRGGIRYFLTPTLDISALTWIHTEAADIAGAEKPCFKIPCPDPIEERCDAIGVCIEAGILTERHFPELVAWYLRNAMVAHEIRLKRQMFMQAVAGATTVQTNPSFGAFSAVFGAIALQVADLVEKHSLCESIGVEIVMPYWARNLFLADIARQNARDLAEIDPSLLSRVFATLGVRIQWVRSLPPDVPEEIGGENPPPGWPEAIPFLMYPAGAFQLGRGAEINLGPVYDSNKFVTNDYTALFMEECVALINRGPEARLVIVPVCPDGATAAQVGVDCPLDGGPFTLPDGEGEGE